MRSEEWLIDVRVEEAKRLLDATWLLIEEDAPKLGFVTVAALRYHFHGQLGLTPQGYRKLLRRQRLHSKAREVCCS